MLEAVGVRKSYGSTLALAGVDLTVGAGEILGLLGANGAGKSTFVSIVAGIRRPDAGTVRVAGIDVARSAQRVKSLVGFAPQESGVYPTLTVVENLRFFAGLAGVRRGEVRERVDALAGALGLDALRDRRAGALSGGERRRLHTAIALVHEPRLVLLDEPTTGADVRTRGQILALVRRLAADGAAIVYSTHYLPEIEELGADVACIDAGRIVAHGRLDDLVRRHGSSALELRFDATVPAQVRVAGAVVDGTSVRIPTDDPARTAAQLLPQLGEDGMGLRAVEVVTPSLESAFLALTGRRYEDQAEAAA
jgi:ABC-2 type transport system ATP-binding protein